VTSLEKGGVHTIEGKSTPPLLFSDKGPGGGQIWSSNKKLRSKNQLGKKDKEHDEFLRKRAGYIRNDPGMNNNRIHEECDEAAGGGRGRERKGRRLVEGEEGGRLHNLNSRLCCKGGGDFI